MFIFSRFSWFPYLRKIHIFTLICFYQLYVLYEYNTFKKSLLINRMCIIMFEYNIETIYEMIFMLYYEFITNKLDSLVI